MNREQLAHSLLRLKDYGPRELDQPSRELLAAAAAVIDPAALPRDWSMVEALVALAADPKLAAARLQELKAATAEHAAIVTEAASAKNVLGAARAQQERERAEHQGTLEAERAAHECSMLQVEKVITDRETALAESERQHAAEREETARQAAELNRKLSAIKEAAGLTAR